MKILDIAKRSARNLRQAKVRTLLTALAISVGTFALTFTLAVSNGAQEFVGKIISDNFDPAELIVVKDEAVLGRQKANQPVEYDTSIGVDSTGSTIGQIKQLTGDDIKKVRSTSGVEQVREGLILNVQYVTRPGQKKFTTSIVAFSPAQNPDLLAGKVPKPFGNHQVLLPEAYLAALGFADAQEAVGKSINFAVQKPVDQQLLQQKLESPNLGSASELRSLAQTNTVEQQYSIAGVLKKPVTAQPGTELAMYIGIDDANAINDLATKGTDKYQKYSYAYVKVKDGQNEVALKKMQDTLKQQGYKTQSIKETQAFLNQIIGILRAIVLVFGLISLVAAVFGVVNTMYISVLQRTREIGLMKALGMRKKDVRRLFIYEAGLIGFIGSLLGSGSAALLGVLLNPVITKQLKLEPGTELLIFKPSQIAILCVALTVIAMISGLLPAIKAARMNPIEALRTE